MKNQNKTAIIILVLGVLFAGVIGISKIGPSTKSVSGSPLSKELSTTYTSIPTPAGKTDFLKQSENLTKKVDPELVDLDSQIITCDPSVDGLLSSAHSSGGSCVAPSGNALQSVDGKYLGGQCCSALVSTDDYHANLKKLQAYKSMPNIPLDPMHTPVETAKMWIDYDKATALTPAEQAIYDQAYAISKEKPCCCKCWHYFVNEGIAKKMIKDETYSALQIANFWDASDICGA